VLLLPHLLQNQHSPSPSVFEKHLDPAKTGSLALMSRLFPRNESIARYLFRDERKYTRAKSLVAIDLLSKCYGIQKAKGKRERFSRIGLRGSGCVR
jgi:hypothetical protein